jgi:hypothetical protein
VGLSHAAQQRTIVNAITLSDRHADTDEGVSKYQEACWTQLCA